VDNRTWGQLARIAKELQAPYIIIDVLDSSGRVIVGKEVSNYGFQGVGRARKIVEDVLKPPKKSKVEKLRNLALAAGSAGALALMGEDAEVEASPISNIIGKLGRINYGRYGKNIPGTTGDTPLVEKVKYLAKKAMDPEVKKDQGIYNTGDVINILKKGVPEDELNHSGIKDFLINYEKEQVKLGKKKTIPIENILDYIQSNKMVSRGKVYGGVPKFTIPEGSAKRIDLINKKKKFDTEHDSIKVRRSHLDVKFGADSEKLTDYVT